MLFVTAIHYACVSERHDNDHLHILRRKIPRQNYRGAENNSMTGFEKLRSMFMTVHRR